MHRRDSSNFLSMGERTSFTRTRVHYQPVRGRLLESPLKVTCLDATLQIFLVWRSALLLDRTVLRKLHASTRLFKFSEYGGAHFFYQDQSSLSTRKGTVTRKSFESYMPRRDSSNFLSMAKRTSFGPDLTINPGGDDYSTVL